MTDKYTREQMATDAKLYASRVNAYWINRGHDVRAAVAWENGLHGWPRIVSDTRNGLPIKR